MFVEAFFRALVLLGKGVWVRHNTIEGLRVWSSSSGSILFIGRILLHTREGNRLFRLLLFPSQPWGYGP